MSAFAGRSVLVTGHTGFKGAWLALWLQRLGAKVHGFALEPETGGAPSLPHAEGTSAGRRCDGESLFEEARVAEGMVSHVIGDVRDHAALAATVKSAQPEVVFHLAAQALVRRSYREPRETFETNVQGTVNLLEAVRQAGGVRVCVVITSDKCYENRETGQAYRETDAMGGFDPYSASKGCAELIVGAWRRSFFPPGKMNEPNVSLSSARAGNVIGGGDWAEDRIVPDCVRALLKGESILVRNPGAIRPWQHVLEPLGGYLTLAARQLEIDGGLFAEAYNFGPAPAGSVPVRDIVERVIQAWGSGKWHGPEQTTAAAHEATLLKLDITKAANRLGWKPAYGVEQAVDETVAWYRSRATSGFDARLMCLKQIEAYESAAHLPWVLRNES